MDFATILTKLIDGIPFNALEREAAAALGAEVHKLIEHGKAQQQFPSEPGSATAVLQPGVSTSTTAGFSEPQDPSPAAPLSPPAQPDGGSEPAGTSPGVPDENTVTYG